MSIIAQTVYGKIMGKEMNGCTCFLGVPFAKPPVGELRFRKPQRLDKWEGIIDCTRYASYCPQPTKPFLVDKSVQASEDCLNLNIYTPACDNKKRPVVVCIHGGAYLTGTAMESSFVFDELSVKSDIVFVTVQYRLGPLGCVDFSLLSGANGRFDSNCGTWDQVFAIDWVIENIAFFGGDPEKITITGPSAGGTSVMTLIASPYTKGKIKRAIMESPATFIPLTKENGLYAARDIINRLGIAEEEAFKLADLPAEVLCKATSDSEYDYLSFKPYTIPTGPVVDGDLVPELPFDALMKGAADGVDILMGTTKDEGSMFATGLPIDLFPTKNYQLIKFFNDHPSVDRNKLLSLYPKYPSRKSFQDIGKEIFFHYGVLALAENFAKRGNKTFVYHFDYYTPQLKMLTLGAMHCENTMMLAGKTNSILYMFKDKRSKAVTAQLQHFWCNFARFGNVNGNGEELWSDYSHNKSTYFLNVHSSLKQNPFKQVENAYGGLRPYGQ